MIPLASVRARDRAEPAHGVVVPFGLASSLFYDEQFGDYAVMDKPHLHLFDGLVTKRHIPTLLPLFEQMARERQTFVMAARDVDEDVLAMVALNKKRGSMRGAILVPDGGQTGPSIRDLQRASGGGVGTANDDGLHVEQPSLPPQLVVTLHETLVVAPRQNFTGPATLGLLYVGGEDIAEARARTRVARQLLSARSLIN